jgi:hypothetical protein
MLALWVLAVVALAAYWVSSDGGSQPGVGPEGSSLPSTGAHFGNGPRRLKSRR